jgi:predicted short-subunit dehydrogenase-like oxidoreductase (DUF2520 family)
VKRGRSPTPLIIVVGPGRLGGALARGLLAAGERVRGWSHRAQATRTWKRLGIRIASRTERAHAALWVLAVPDEAIPAAHASVLPHMGSDAACIHCAGALTWTVLKRGDSARACGSFHPLCAISGPEDSLAGHAAAVAASHRWLEAFLRRLARTLGLSPLRIPERDRAAYHAGAVLGAGAVVALLSLAAESWARLGVAPAARRAALLALARSALNGAKRRGFRDGLTGPWARGDVERIQAHLRALPPKARAAYRVLGVQGVALVSERLTALQRRALTQLLIENT